ncbi:glucosamine-6-phosphate deaminase [Fodinibius roseus]|uniref:Glucosamine-6-phosphate deaminase n=1 Tax=Fodinibius roseus TaxID=1194090 RepID=A0A1M5KZM5_9BACT|nr:hypothetical protein [Fodinibius roseus]SHG58322.1 glucosamine-6-phosphate deaminase [Fodinibius roseus]
MNRQEEIQNLLYLSPDEMSKKAGDHLLLLDDIEDLHHHFARNLADQIKRNNAQNKSTVLILPFGPVPQYENFTKMVNSEQISLHDCTFFLMDEYCTNNGIEIDSSHPLSFQAGLWKYFDKINNELCVPQDQVIFPDHENIHQLADMIERAGGIETCYGGIGIHGHVAFNEPEPQVLHSDPRMVYLNEYTITINAIRAGVGGDLENFPRKALTLGMRQIMNADKIRLYCRNGVQGMDWANTILRLALFGEPGDDYPVTYIKQHPDWQIITDMDTASSPENLLKG